MKLFTHLIPEEQMKRRRFPTVLIVLLILASCTKHYIGHKHRSIDSDTRMLAQTDSLQLPYFKVHLKSGEVCLMEHWSLNAKKDTISGTGKMFSMKRTLSGEGEYRIPLSSIAIIETNKEGFILSKDNERIAALTVLTGVNIGLDIFCLVNPKACFGSCPTFYVEGRKEFFSAAAEGFSSAIAPSLEMPDVDALRSTVAAGPVRITMKNEALETHVLNSVELLAVTKKMNERVFHNRDGRYFRCGIPFAPDRAEQGKRSIKDEIQASDGSEYFSTSDSSDLAAKEEIVMEFNRMDAGKYGLVVNFRQTLMTTFLLYNGLGYMGDDVGYYFSDLERRDRFRDYIYNPFQRLGKISLQLWNDDRKRWEQFGELHETGPIAHNLQIVPLPVTNEKGTIRVRLLLAKGMWRIDQLALTQVIAEEQPLMLSPSEVQVISGNIPEDGALNADDETYVVSLPGNEYVLQYRLPETVPGNDYELFLQSKGYYLEWIRAEWMKEKNPVKLKAMLLNNDKVWKELAVEFKRQEAAMESVFWNSKVSGGQ